MYRCVEKLFDWGYFTVNVKIPNLFGFGLYCVNSKYCQCNNDKPWVIIRLVVLLLSVLVCIIYQCNDSYPNILFLETNVAIDTCQFHRGSYTRLFWQRVINIDCYMMYKLLVYFAIRALRRTTVIFACGINEQHFDSWYHHHLRRRRRHRHHHHHYNHQYHHHHNYHSYIHEYVLHFIKTTSPVFGQMVL